MNYVVQAIQRFFRYLLPKIQFVCSGSVFQTVRRYIYYHLINPIAYLPTRKAARRYLHFRSPVHCCTVYFFLPYPWCHWFDCLCVFHCFGFPKIKNCDLDIPLSLLYIVSLEFSYHRLPSLVLNQRHLFPVSLHYNALESLLAAFKPGIMPPPVVALT